MHPRLRLRLLRPATAQAALPHADGIPRDVESVSMPADELSSEWPDVADYVRATTEHLEAPE